MFYFPPDKDGQPVSDSNGEIARASQDFCSARGLISHDADDHAKSIGESGIFREAALAHFAHGRAWKSQSVKPQLARMLQNIEIGIAVVLLLGFAASALLRIPQYAIAPARITVRGIRVPTPTRRCNLKSTPGDRCDFRSEEPSPDVSSDVGHAEQHPESHSIVSRTVERDNDSLNGGKSSQEDATFTAAPPTKVNFVVTVAFSDRVASNTNLTTPIHVAFPCLGLAHAHASITVIRRNRNNLEIEALVAPIDMRDVEATALIRSRDTRCLEGSASIEVMQDRAFFVLFPRIRVGMFSLHRFLFSMVPNNLKGARS